VVGGSGLVVGKSKRHRLTVESFSVHRGEPLLVQELGSDLHVLSKDGFIVLDEGPRTTLDSDQRVLRF